MPIHLLCIGKRSHPSASRCTFSGGEGIAGKALKELTFLYQDELAGRGLYQRKAKGDRRPRSP